MSSAKSWHNQALGQAQAKESIDAASRYGIIEAIKRHLADGADVNSKYFLPFEKPATHNLGTPLHFAVEGGHIKIAPLIIQPIPP
jgi:hypothetical protein